MKDIAAEAVVSVTTVFKILNNVDMHISEVTRERVLGLVQQYHYIFILRRRHYEKDFDLCTDPYDVDFNGGLRRRERLTVIGFVHITLSNRRTRRFVPIRLSGSRIRRCVSIRLSGRGT